MQRTSALLVIMIMLLMTESGHAQVFTGGSMGVHYDRGYYAEAAPVIGYRMGIVDLGVSPFFSYRNHRDRDARYSYGSRCSRR